VLDLGLSSLQPVAGLEGDGDGRPLLQVGLDHQGPTDDGGHDRYQPDQLQRKSLFRLGHSLGDVVQPGFLLHFTHDRISLSQIRRGSNSMAANMVSTTTAPKASAPGPALMVARAPICTSAARMATT